MTKARINKGRDGEELAVVFLKEQGYRILERNYRNRFGEIDIVAQDQNTICFIEVKTRFTDRAGTGFEAILARKQRKISEVALSYLKTKKFLSREARFDVVAVKRDFNGSLVAQIIKDAFALSTPYAY